MEPVYESSRINADQSRRGVQVLARAADRRCQSLRLDRAIELLNVIGVMLQRLCPVGDGVGRNISNSRSFP